MEIYCFKYEYDQLKSVDWNKKYTIAKNGLMYDLGARLLNPITAEHFTTTKFAEYKKNS